MQWLHEFLPSANTIEWALENDSKAFSAEPTSYWLQDQDPAHLACSFYKTTSQGTPQRRVGRL